VSVLDVVAQFQSVGAGFVRMQEAIVASPADAGEFAHHRTSKLRFHLLFFVDLPRRWRVVARRSKARLENRSPSPICPILRSSSAVRLSSARFLPTPLKVCSPCSCSSRRQRCRSLDARPGLAQPPPCFTRFRSGGLAVNMNSLLKFLRDFTFRFPSDF
jgi:hypothetical protein